MDMLNGVIDFIQSPVGAGIFMALFAMSEALASIPSVKANGVFQLLSGVLAKLVRKPTV